MLKTIAAAGLLATTLFMTATPALADCEDREAAGTIGGAIVGGIIGNQFGHGGGRAAATVGGALLGGIVGHEIGKDSCRDERYDAYYYDDAYTDAFEYGDNRRYEWSNPRSHHHGWIRPTKYYEDGWHDNDGPCRAFEARIYADGDDEDAHGVACRTGHGRWKIVTMQNDED